MPIGGAADDTKIGHHAALAISMTPFRSSNRLRIEATSAQLMDKAPASTSRALASVTANLVLAPASPPKAPSGYVIAGIGAYHQRIAGKGSDHAGLNIGAGVSFNFGAFGAFTEARLHYIATGAKTKLFPITFGLVF